MRRPPSPSPAAAWSWRARTGPWKCFRGGCSRPEEASSRARARASRQSPGRLGGMVSRAANFCIDAHDPRAQVAWWGQVLDDFVPDADDDEGDDEGDDE